MPIHTRFNNSPVSIIEIFLKKRRDIPIADLPSFTTGLFELAIKDKKAAALLLRENNRFLSVVSRTIGQGKLLEFARANPELVEKLIVFSQIELSIAALMRREAEVALQLKNAFEVRVDSLIDALPADADGRTQKAIMYNQHLITQNEVRGILIGERFIPMVDRNTRNFNQQLCSAGESSKREIILLDPENEQLRSIYSELARQITDRCPLQVLRVVKEWTRVIFANSEPDNFIKNKLKTNQNIIQLHEFVAQRQGVCRHHALLNAYLMSRLIEDGVLNGEVIHHRQSFDRGAHTWNLFRSQEGKLYSLDSLWNDVTCITDEPGKINILYRFNVEDEISRRYSSPANLYLNNEPEALLPSSSGLTSHDKILQIKEMIETRQFFVGNYFFFQGGRKLTLTDKDEKVVPHRIYAIYEVIKAYEQSDVKDGNATWVNIKQYAEEALNKPRRGRHGTTTSFYETIRDEKLVTLPNSAVNLSN